MKQLAGVKGQRGHGTDSSCSAGGNDSKVLLENEGRWRWVYGGYLLLGCEENNSDGHCCQIMSNIPPV